jgi:hypothetical protein
VAKLEELIPGASIEGILADTLVSIITAQWSGQTAVHVIYRIESRGGIGEVTLFRSDEAHLVVRERTRKWMLDGDGDLLKLSAEALRIRMLTCLTASWPSMLPR